MNTISKLTAIAALFAGLIVMPASTADASHAPTRCIYALELADELHYAYEQLFWAGMSGQTTRMHQEAAYINDLMPLYEADRDACRS